MVYYMRQTIFILKIISIFLSSWQCHLIALYSCFHWSLKRVRCYPI